MATIEQDLQAIQQAVYGEEVRGSIIDAISKCYTDTVNGVNAAEAAAASAEEAVDEAVSEANAATSAANTAAANANTAASAAEDITESMADTISGIQDDISSLDTETSHKLDAEYKSASGDIVTFDNAPEGMGLKNVAVRLEPVQDLHGQEAPYPAGGSAQIWDEDWEVGTISGGSDSPSSVTLRSKGYIPVTPEATYYFHAPNNKAKYVFCYDENKTYKSTISLTTPATFTIPAGCYFIRFTYTYYIEDYTTYKHDISINYPATVTTYFPYSNICPITGHSSVTVMRTGKNLLNKSDGQTSSSNWWIGSGTVNTEPDGTFVLNAGTYTFSASESQAGIYVRKNGSSVVTVYDNTKATFTLTEKTPIGLMLYKTGVTIDYWDTIDIQLELNSTASAYERYQGISVQIPLGQTVYGGTLDPVKGTLTVTRVCKTATSCNSVATASTGIKCATIEYSSEQPLPERLSNDSISSEYKYRINAPSDSGWFRAVPSGTTGVNLLIYDSRFVDKATADSILAVEQPQFCYYLDTPLAPITLDPVTIQTLLGYNAVWSDSGAIDLDYPVSLLDTINEVVEPIVEDTLEPLVEDVNGLKTAIVNKAPLIVGTASGDIASFPDGADGMEVKALSVNIEPVQDLHGYDSPWPAGGGKNKWPFGDISSNATNVPFTLAAGTYTLSATCTDSSFSFNVRFNLEDSTSAVARVSSGAQATITLEANCASVNYSKTGSADITNIQLELGTATDYTPYSNICPITGHSSVTVTRTGVNLVDLTIATGSEQRTIELAKPIGQTITVSAKNNSVVTSESVWRVAVKYKDGSVGYVGDAGFPTGTFPKSFSASADNPIVAVEVRSIRMTSGSYDICVSIGTDTAYHAYQGISVQIPLGQTVYGGTLDPVNGELIVDRACVDLGSLTWTTWDKGRVYSTGLSSTIMPCESGVLPNLIATKYATKTAARIASDESLIGIGVNNTNIVVRTGDGNNPSGDIVYELAQPVEVTLTEQQITTLLGVNNVFSDSGDVSVEYPADTKLYIDRKITEAIANALNA